MDAFPLERFTTDPNILKYSEPLRELYTKIKAELGSFRRIIQGLQTFIQEDEDWLLHKIQDWRFKDPEILNGLFLKIYDANMATLNWPPLNYPKSAPLLVHVPGYHGESEIEWFMRILRKIGLDMHLGYAPLEVPPPYTPDMTNPFNPFEKSWLSDPTIREAFAAIHAGLVNPPPKYAENPINNTMLLHGLLSGSSLRKNMGQPDRSRLPSDDNQILASYIREWVIYEDTYMSSMHGVDRFYGRILGSDDLDSFYAKLPSKSREFEGGFCTRNITPEKLTRTGLPWDQQLFTVIGPSVNPQTDSFMVLSLSTGNSSSVNVSDTVWIQMNSEMESSEDTPCSIQGAYMSIYKPFLWLYFNGVRAVSPTLLEMLKGSETNQELDERKALQALIHPQGSLLAPFTLTGKITFSPLMSNLKRIRKTLKKSSWHFWGPKPSKLIEEFIDRYGREGMQLMKSPEITAAAKALQNHHTTANKDALIQALKDAIRTYKAGKPPIEDSSQMFSTPKKISNLGGTDYSAYNAGIKDLEAEMAKPWYARTWGKSKAVIKQLLETYLELFSDKGDLNIVNALLAVKKYKSHDAIEALKTAIQTRRYTAHSLPILEGDVRKIPLPQAIRNEYARLDPFHKPANIRGEQPRDQVVNTNYSTYNASIKDLDAEMAKPWYAQTWGKSKAIIKQLLDTYLTTFIARDDTEIIRALEGLKKLKSQDAIDMLKAAIQARKVRNAERARIPVYKSDAKDYADDIVDAMNVFKTLKNLNARILLQVAIEVRVHNGDPNLPPRSIAYSLLHEEEVPRPPVRKTQKSQKPKSPSPIKELTGPQVEERIQKVTQAALSGLQPRTAFINSPVTSPVSPTPNVPLFVSQQSNKPKPNLYISDNSNVLTLSENSNIPKNESVQKPNVVTSKLPTNANTVSVPLVSGQAGGFAPSLMSSFVTNGMSLLPVASYLGYRQMKNRKTRRR